MGPQGWEREFFERMAQHFECSHVARYQLRPDEASAFEAHDHDDTDDVDHDEASIAASAFAAYIAASAFEAATAVPTTTNSVRVGPAAGCGAATSIAAGQGGSGQPAHDDEAKAGQGGAIIAACAAPGHTASTASACTTSAPRPGAAEGTGSMPGSGATSTAKPEEGLEEEVYDSEAALRQLDSSPPGAAVVHILLFRLKA